MSDKQIWLYHKDEPSGKLFNLEEADDNMEQMLKDGWVDTPAKLKSNYKPTATEVSAIATMSKKQIIAKCESLGFKVLTTEQVNEIIESSEKPLVDYTDEELVNEVKSRGITYMPSKEEIIEFAEGYGLTLTGQTSLIEQFAKNPTDLTKEELVVVGNDFDLSLKMTMNEATMIGHIEQRIKDLQTDPE